MISHTCKQCNAKFELPYKSRTLLCNDCTEKLRNMKRKARTRRLLDRWHELYPIECKALGL